MKSFSQRKGLKPVSEVIQINSMDELLRNSLWNVLDMMQWSAPDFVDGYEQLGSGIDSFSKSLWFHFFKKPIDLRPAYGREILKEIRQYFFSCAWNEVYDFIEFVLQTDYVGKRHGMVDVFNMALDSEMSGYRIVGGVVTEVTSKEEITMLEEAIRDTRFADVSAHLARALQLLANRENPDYLGSVKESVAAIESIAKIITDKPAATLADALKIMEASGRVPSELKDGFNKLYGYTRSAGGIQHSMMTVANLSAADARFFLLSCTSFVHFLKSKLP